jgi:hypothetical protein
LPPRREPRWIVARLFRDVVPDCGYLRGIASDELLAEIDLREYPIEGPHRRELREATVKCGGNIWRIHTNDTDPFPSNPHAHNLETGLKLDLSTGLLYLGRKPAGGTFKRKHFLTLRQLAASKGILLPPLAWK